MMPVDQQIYNYQGEINPHFDSGCTDEPGSKFFNIFPADPEKMNVDTKSDAKKENWQERKSVEVIILQKSVE